MDQTYRIVRHYEDSRVAKRTLEEGVSLEDAQAHCNDPATSGEETVSVNGQSIRTRFFDGYYREG